MKAYGFTVRALRRSVWRWHLPADAGGLAVVGAEGGYDLHAVSQGDAGGAGHGTGRRFVALAEGVESVFWNLPAWHWAKASRSRARISRI
ncbi:hypothetical protein [Rhodothermus marinus]|uniref:hypothetical protein n=1 Tax=Rhodothermus marinus TaxID=29549 RepID=UPI000B31C406|nr:hypothetical protein [Rhodothermus marinus]